MQKFSNATKASCFPSAFSFVQLFIFEWSPWGVKVVADILDITSLDGSSQRKKWDGVVQTGFPCRPISLRDNEVFPRRVSFASHWSKVYHMSSSLLQRCQKSMYLVKTTGLRKICPQNWAHCQFKQNY